MRLSQHIVRNEKGIAMIGIIILMTAGMLSYTAFTATSYVMMMNESKRQKRQTMGFETMQQIGNLLLVARQRHHNARAAVPSQADCSGPAALGNTRQIGNFCFPNANTSAAGGACVDHPGDPTEEVCILGDVGAATTPTVQIAVRSKRPRSLIENLDRWARTAHVWMGEKAFNLAKRLTDEAPVAHALSDRMFFPILGAVQSYDWTDGLVTCDATTDYTSAGVDPAVMCMPCSEDGVNSGPSASCIRLKVCLRDMNGFGGCTAGTTSHWFWQTVAVTAPITMNPYP